MRCDAVRTIHKRKSTNLEITTIYTVRMLPHVWIIDERDVIAMCVLRKTAPLSARDTIQMRNPFTHAPFRGNFIEFLRWIKITALHVGYVLFGTDVRSTPKCICCVLCVQCHVKNHVKGLKNISRASDNNTNSNSFRFFFPNFWKCLRDLRLSKHVHNMSCGAGLMSETSETSELQHCTYWTGGGCTVRSAVVIRCERN